MTSCTRSRRRSRHLNSAQRELIIWLCSLKDKLEENTRYYKPVEQKEMQSLVKDIENMMLLLMDGIDPKEGNALINASKRVIPTLIINNFHSRKKEDVISVNADDVYDLAEYALEYCKFSGMVRDIFKMTNAKKIHAYLKENFRRPGEDYKTCKLRKLLLKLLVPGISENGCCEYIRD